jgi:hypothetical protein
LSWKDSYNEPQGGCWVEGREGLGDHRREDPLNGMTCMALCKALANRPTQSSTVLWSFSSCQSFSAD